MYLLDRLGAAFAALRRRRLDASQWGELGLIALWAVWVGRAYLNLDPTVYPTGNEYSSSVQTHFIWPLVCKCGTCILWNGFMQGGAPALAELHGSLLHPLVIVTTLIWGVINGSKIALVASLAMAGWAQWWLAKVMRLGRVARLWSAGLCVVGGHLAGRMELGAFGVVLSTAACSLVLAPGIELARTGSRRSAVLLGIVLALALLAGQGYMQVGMVLGILPAFLVLLLDDQFRLQPAWKPFVLAGLVAVLLAAIWWVPLAHFWPNIYKSADVEFRSVQPLEYIPLNLLIRDADFYRTQVLGKFPYPHLYVDYLGWVPVLLAVVALRLAPRNELRLLVFFLVGIALVYLVSGAVTLRLLAPVLSSVAGGVRHPPQIAGLANPMLLAVAAWGLDRLLKLDGPRLVLALAGQDAPKSGLSVRVIWLVLVVPLIWSLQSAFVFSRTWLTTVPYRAGVYQAVQALKTDTAEWVRFPFGEHFWISPALEAGLKLGTGIRTWNWKERAFPPVIREGTRDPISKDAPNFLGTIDGVNLVAHPENEYAFVRAGSESVPCRAAATGGHIDVICQAEVSGLLVVQENAWSGWYVWRDGKPAPLVSNRWLAVDAPAGRHEYRFRYLPWDVLAGFLLTLAGIAWSVWLWRHSSWRAPDDASA